jgi:hypothetical protein
MDIEDMPCEFVCGIEIEVDDACELEVYSVPEEEHAYIETGMYHICCISIHNIRTEYYCI